MRKSPLPINIESEPALELLSRIAAANGPRGGSRVSGQSDVDVTARTRKSRPAKVREQVRPYPLGRAREVYPAPRNGRAFALPAPTCISAADHRSGALEAASGSWPNSLQRCAADGNKITHVDFGGGLGHSLLLRRPEAPPAHAAMPRWSRGLRIILGCTLQVRAGTNDRRQCRTILVTPRDLVKHGEAKKFRHYRRGDERPDRPHVRSAPRTSCHSLGPRRARRHPRPTWSAPVAKAGIISR